MFWRKNKYVADIEEDKCVNCGLCVRICPHNALETAVIQGKKMTFINRPENCMECARCVNICPTGAIKLIDRYC